MIDQKQHWESTADYPWLPAEQGPAVIMRKQNPDPQSGLSVYEVPEDEATITRVIVAFAATMEHKDKRDYVLFPNELVEQVGLRIVNEAGKTPDDAANALHRDIVTMTCAQFGGLYDLMFRRGRVGRREPWEIEERIKDGILAGRLDRYRVNRQLLKRLGVS
jgi:hypothetical protein